MEVQPELKLVENVKGDKTGFKQQKKETVDAEKLEINL